MMKHDSKAKTVAAKRDQCWQPLENFLYTTLPPSVSPRQQHQQDLNSGLWNCTILIKKGEKNVQIYPEKLKQSLPCLHWIFAVRTRSAWSMRMIQKILYIVVVGRSIRIVHQFNLLMLLFTLTNNRGATLKSLQRSISYCTHMANKRLKHSFCYRTKTLLQLWCFPLTFQWNVCISIIRHLKIKQILFI